MSSTWVVVADSARARIFDFDETAWALTEREDLVHPESRLRPGEITTDRPGSTFRAVGPGRQGLDPRSSVKEVERRDFARTLARRLDKAVDTNEVQKLIVMAGPKFLGDLRDCLDSPTRRAVSLEIEKNLAKHDAREILEALPGAG
ncbi:MAG TPA: host attachment protein [Deltaproteobacteria bacterium]|nr:host attachment protein [Deltaproteobacteria bacterium]